MSRKNEPDSTWLRETLRDWDPARDDGELDGTERARMRRRVLSATVEPVRIGMPVRALATAAVLVLTVALGWGIWDDAVRQVPTTAAPAARRAPEPGAAGEVERKARQIQFSTPGGTRVVWTLDPDFEV